MACVDPLVFEHGGYSINTVPGLTAGPTLRKTLQAMNGKAGKAPDATWFRGQSIDYVKARVGTPRARIYQLLDFNVVNPLLQEHFHGIQNHRLMIWSLIYLEEALRIWRLA